MNEEIKCKTHPDAPHGFVRNASHTEDRYVCECEYWEEPKVNERIKELAEQAGFIDRGSNHTAYMSFDHEKFAALIVKECRTVINDVYHKTPLELCGPLLTADEEISKHFYGVEE